MSPFRFDVVTLFPEVFGVLDRLGVIGRAIAGRIAEIKTHNPRNFVTDRYRKVDDQPYGGGAGMVLKPEPVFAAVDSIPVYKKRRILLLTPQGKLVTQPDFHRWASEYDQLVLICGNYEGFDERIRSLADEEISLGDFVLTGGELPAMVIVNGVLRLIPGTVGTQESLLDESHADILLEHPHFTRPADFQGMRVPDVLLSGDHRAVYLWRKRQSQLRTQRRRPDLFSRWLGLSMPSPLKEEKCMTNSHADWTQEGYEVEDELSG